MGGLAEKWELTVKEEGRSDPMGVEKKKVEGLGTKELCIRLVLLPRSVGTAILFMDIVPVNLATLREHCAEKGISLKQGGLELREVTRWGQSQPG